MKNNKGITLIALVITIVVLIILAGVAISLTLGDNGIFKKATMAKEDYAIAAAKEQIELKIAEIQAEKEGKATLEELVEYLKDDPDIDYTVSLTQITASLTTDIAVGDAQEIYVVYKTYQFKVNKKLKTEYVSKVEVEVENKVDNAIVENIETETHTAIELTYSWSELANIAKHISNKAPDKLEAGDANIITSDTAEITMKIGSKTYTLGVGDYTTVDSKKVHILGFNHDELADKTVYGGTNTYAGISFEYVDFLSTDVINSQNVKCNWVTCELYAKLNDLQKEESFINTIEIKSYIKKVVKQYEIAYNNLSLATSQDYLWLLSGAEVWESSPDTRYTTGKDGKRYKYYTLGQSAIKNDTYWWLRSQGGSSNFSVVNKTGEFNGAGYWTIKGVAPGFAI